MLIKIQSIKFTCNFLTICRSASTQPLKEDKVLLRVKKKLEKNEKPRKSSGTPSFPKDMQKYFETNMRKNVLTTYPENLLKKKNLLPTGSYLTCKKTARIIADELLKNLPAGLPILEANPGTGLITSQLLENSTNPIFLYEPESYFYNDVMSFMQEYPDREIRVTNKDLLSIDRLSYIDSLDGGNRAKDLLKGLESKDYSDEPIARLFAVSFNKKFLKSLIRSIVFRNLFTSIGRVEYYLCITPETFISLTCSGSAGYMTFRTSSVLFQLLFEYEIIDKFNEKDFIPWFLREKTSDRKRRKELLSIDKDLLYFVKIVPRQNLLKFCPIENLTALWFFITQNFTKKTNRVIPQLENWIPGCGVRLIINSNKGSIANNMSSKSEYLLPKFSKPCKELNNNEIINNLNIFTEFGELTPNQAFTIFHQFVNFPEFKHSNFGASLEQALIKSANTEVEENESETVVEEKDSK